VGPPRRHTPYHLPEHADRVVTLAFSNDGKTLVSAGKDKDIKLWDVDAAKERATLQGTRMK